MSLFRGSSVRSVPDPATSWVLGVGTVFVTSVSFGALPLSASEVFSIFPCQPSEEAFYPIPTEKKKEEGSRNQNSRRGHGRDDDRR
uniref:Uncharacterized protein n=1 Tax=Arundo donax TaxID=35708 RepID=A0A0A9HJ04_ARUDO